MQPLSGPSIPPPINTSAGGGALGQSALHGSRLRGFCRTGTENRLMIRNHECYSDSVLARSERLRFRVFTTHPALQVFEDTKDGGLPGVG